MIERKCLKCGTWNKDENFCTHCKNAISPKEIIKIEEKKKKIEVANKPKDKYQLFVEKLKGNKYLIVRIFYRIGHSIGIVFAAIGGFLAWMVAMVNA